MFELMRTQPHSQAALLLNPGLTEFVTSLLDSKLKHRHSFGNILFFTGYTGKTALCLPPQDRISGNKEDRKEDICQC